MSALILLGGMAAACLLVYLLAVLLFPEKFS